MNRSCFACGKVGIGLDSELCAKARREEVEYIRRHKMYTRVSRETCPRETGRAPIKTAETDKGQPGKPNVRATWVAKEYKTHAGQGCTRQRCHSLCCRRSPRADVEEKLWHWLMCGERTSTLQHEEGYLSSYHPRITSQAMHTCAGCCDTVCAARATPHKNWEEELASTLSILKSTRRSACPCVWKGRIK